jgi:hypothetical protein
VRDETTTGAALVVVQLPIDSLHEDPDNARTHNERNLSAIKSSLAHFGQQKPIVVDDKGCVIAGNGTLVAAKALGWTTIAAVRSTLVGESSKRAYALADNRTAELAEWDYDALSAALVMLGEGADRDATGFTPAEIEVFAGIGPTPVTGGAVEPLDGMPAIKDGERAPFQVMSFTLHDDQVEIVKAALDEAKKMGPFVGPNQNANGNALARIAEFFRSDGSGGAPF